MNSNKRRIIPGIVVFLFGLVFTTIGALFKILHWPYSSEILSIGSLIEVSGIVMVIVTLIQIYKCKR